MLVRPQKVTAWSEFSRRSPVFLNRTATQARLKDDPEMKAEASAAADAALRQLSAEPGVSVQSVFAATAADVALAKRKTSTRDERRA